MRKKSELRSSKSYMKNIQQYLDRVKVLKAESDRTLEIDVFLSDNAVPETISPGSPRSPR